ncbi:MAG TPA: right-handed parallel beta-helix repeat-containing protein, partial [Bacteroidia bacterium]|nr:right-handed parallel beta-helix repeat-containing protein [Bacteroidia bacterium]
CSIFYSGSNAVTANQVKGLTLEYDSILATNNIALVLSSCSNAVIRNNLLKNTGINPGMGQSGNNTYEGILLSGNNNTLEYNVIDSVGYNAIEFEGDSIFIRNNLISHFNLSKDDGGGIYTWTGASNLTPSTNRIISNNIVLNGVGAGAGTDSPSDQLSEGIYMDDNTGHVSIIGNTIASCGDDGILLHNAHNINVQGNTVFNNRKQLEMSHDDICPTCPITQITQKDNILFSKWIDQNVLNLGTTGNDISGFGTFDSNYYCRPYDDKLDISQAYVVSSTPASCTDDLAMWQAAGNKDVHTQKSPLTYSPYTISAVNGSNMYPNGTFSADINGLYTYSAAGNENAVWASTSPLDGGALHFYFSSGGSSSNIAKIIIGAGNISGGHQYLVKFSLKGTLNNKTLNVFLRQSLSPYANLSVPGCTKISNYRTEVQLLLTAQVSEPNASLIFEIPQTDS